MPTNDALCERFGCHWQREPGSRYCRDHDSEQAAWQRANALCQAAVNAELEARIGMTSDDLPDFAYAAHFDAGTDPIETAKMAL